MNDSQDREFYREKILGILRDYHLPAPACVIYGVLITRQIITRQIEITFNDTKNILEKLVNDERVKMFCDPEKDIKSPMRRTYSLKRN